MEHNNQNSERFEYLKIQVAVLCVVTLCSDAVGYQCFGEHCCLRLQDEVSGAWKRT